MTQHTTKPVIMRSFLAVILIILALAGTASAATATIYNWSFDAGSQSWTSSSTTLDGAGAGSLVMLWDGSDGNPAGSLDATLQAATKGGPNKLYSEMTMWQSPDFSWTNGTPGSANISFDFKVATYTNPGTNDCSVLLKKPDGTAVLIGSTSFTATSGWTRYNYNIGTDNFTVSGNYSLMLNATLSALTTTGVISIGWDNPVIMLFAMPDLLPTAIKPYHYVWTGVPPYSDPFFNLTNYVNVTVNNTGTGDASNFKVRLYADDELIGEKIISLAAGSGSEERFEWKPAGKDPMSWVDTPDGSKITYTTTDRTYTLKATVDEANETYYLTRRDSRTKVIWNGYAGDEPLQNYIKGNVKGGMLYSTGDGAYQARSSVGTTYGTYYNVTYDLEIPGTPELSRLYIYYTWGELPMLAPKIGVTLTTPSGTHTLSMDKGYNDYKGEFASTYKNPWGTYAYNITDYVTTGGTYHVNITNLNDGSDTEFATGYAIAAPAILVVYENTSMPLREYWINEGADLLMGGRKTDGGYLAWWEAMNNATFEGSAGLSNATLGIVSPWADSLTNDEVYFNDHSLGRGIYCGYTVPCTQEKPGLKMVVGSGAQVSIIASDVTAYLAASDNRLSQADDGDCMMPANAFLLVEVAGVPGVSVIQNNVSFGNIIKGGTREILASLKLQNTGSAPANIEAEFITASGATYGLVNATNVIGGSNFSIGPDTYEKLLSNGNLPTYISTLDAGATMNYDAILYVPADQVAGDYAGTVQITWS